MLRAFGQDKRRSSTCQSVFNVLYDLIVALFVVDNRAIQLVDWKIFGISIHVETSKHCMTDDHLVFD